MLRRTKVARFGQYLGQGFGCRLLARACAHVAASAGVAPAQRLHSKCGSSTTSAPQRPRARSMHTGAGPHRQRRKRARAVKAGLSGDPTFENEGSLKLRGETRPIAPCRQWRQNPGRKASRRSPTISCRASLIDFRPGVDAGSYAQSRSRADVTDGPRGYLKVLAYRALYPGYSPLRNLRLAPDAADRQESLGREWSIGIRMCSAGAGAVIA
jgi:hypothetical protein